MTIVACITSNLTRRAHPTNVFVTAKETGLDTDSLVLLNQIRSADKKRVIKKLDSIPYVKMLEVNAALETSLDL